jgi:predicted nucleic acid-binding protein
VTLVDFNVFMYAAGREHPHRKPAAAFMEKVAAGSVEAIIDVEVLQEILHRYRALGRWEEGRQVYDAARTVFPSAVAITDEIVDRARRLLDEFPGLAARDAVHAAVVLAHGLDSICSFDRDFDAVRGLRRIEPR